MGKIEDNRAWLLVIPVMVIVAFSAIVPLMTVVNYSVQDIFGPNERVWVGTEWFEEVLADSRLHDALLKRDSDTDAAALLLELGVTRFVEASAAEYAGSETVLKDFYGYQ